ncbi:GNAT family N-acetyltransferase [Streptomyces sp. WAC 01325]|uniref:GNAT family N-acetyltransferase n=1 Tax=Streptomyces sp. WAC 01325 TaxID=2203202 RepID=UPI00163C48BB|nr:GNAT family N-acetyltransferase [Streptomyces sp. WAC 01325]
MSVQDWPRSTSAVEFGCSLDIRALGQPGDRDRLKGLCPRLSARSRYMRFHGALNELSETFLDQLMDVDHDLREAFVALQGEEIVGVARYVVAAESPSLAEVTVLVADAWQRQGIARHLLSRVRESAVQRGITGFRASVLPSNEPAQRLVNAVAPDHHVFRTSDGLGFRWSHSDPASRRHFARTTAAESSTPAASP